MKVKLKQITKNEAYFEGIPEQGEPIKLNSPLGDEPKKAPSPMENLLLSAAACSAVDVLLILQKMKQEVEHLEVDVEGNRKKMENTKPFESIHLHFIITGAVDNKKAKRAVDLSVEKYCSVIDSLNPNITIKQTFEIIT